MAAVRSAKDIAPSAFAEEASAEGAGAATTASTMATLGVKRASDDLEYDLGAMTVMDPQPLDPSVRRGKEREKYLARRTREAVQLFAHRMFALPYEMTEDGPIAILPAAETKLPRRLALPEPKPETTWQRFAREKGIRSRKKRGKMVWDEVSQEWKPRYGYKRAKDDTKDWAIPAKPGEADDHDPYEERRVEKQKRVLKNKLQQLKNQERAEKEARKSGSVVSKLHKKREKRLRLESSSAAEELARAAARALPDGIAKAVKASEGDVTGIVGQGKQKRPRPAGQTAADKARRIKAAQVGTASMGRFGRKLPGEPEAPKDDSRHRRRPDVSKGEKDRDLAVLREVMHSKSAAATSAESLLGAKGSRAFFKDRK